MPRATVVFPHPLWVPAIQKAGMVFDGFKMLLWFPRGDTGVRRKLHGKNDD
jgi:hypothetical protein